MDGNKNQNTSKSENVDYTEALRKYVELDSYRRSLELPEEVIEEYRFLAQGEYNRNYYFIHPVTGKKLVFRVNFGSQMHLEHQIEYEYEALRILENSGRTPRPLYVDDSRAVLPNGILVMEYLPGHALDYDRELFRAADCLADIHSVPVPEGHRLIQPKNPVRAILEECEEMFQIYADSPLTDPDKKNTIRRLLDLVWHEADRLSPSSYLCCINTELNSTNFLINTGKEMDYLIDWEKPLLGEPAQDLGHFLAPTTTFWKTDIILNEERMHAFVRRYVKAVNGRFDTEDLWERVMVYMTVTCLRGITWCAMAWVEYQQPGRQLVNESTWRKLEEYLNASFLEKIGKFIADRE